MGRKSAGGGRSAGVLAGNQAGGGISVPPPDFDPGGVVIEKFFGCSTDDWIGDDSETRVINTGLFNEILFTRFTSKVIVSPGGTKVSNQPDNQYYGIDVFEAQGISYANADFIVNDPPIVGGNAANTLSIPYNALSFGQSPGAQGQIAFAHGTYGGDGTSSRLIPTGFAANIDVMAILIYGVGASGVDAIKLPGMPGNVVDNNASAAGMAGVTFNGKDFSVGVPPTGGLEDANTVGNFYRWVAFGRTTDGSIPLTPVKEMIVESYVGDGTSFRTIVTGLTSPPKYLSVQGRDNSFDGQKTTDMGGDAFFERRDTSGLSSGIRFDGNDLEIGPFSSFEDGNALGVTYNYFVMC